MRKVVFSVWLVNLFLLMTMAHGEVSLIEGRLFADALIWANCHWQQTEVIGFTDSRFGFYRRAAFIGLTGRISSVTSMRLYCDVADFLGQPAYDLYVNFLWPSGIGLRVGQFKPPLGTEALTKPDKLKLIEYSLLKRFWKPYDPRDVGVMVNYGRSWFDVSAAVINGNSRNRAGDDNNWKDICGRLVLKPFPSFGLQFAASGYYGQMRIETQDLSFRRFTGEFKLDQQYLQFLGEVQHAKVPGGDLRFYIRNSFYVQATYQLSELLEPVGRFQMEFQVEDKYEMGLTGGLNFKLLGDRLKVMVDYDYWRKRSALWSTLNGSEHKFLLQLQAAI